MTSNFAGSKDRKEYLSEIFHHKQQEPPNTFQTVRVQEVKYANSEEVHYKDNELTKITKTRLPSKLQLQQCCCHKVIFPNKKGSAFQYNNADPIRIQQCYR